MASFCAGDHGVSPMVNEGEDAGAAEAIGRDVADVGGDGGVEAGHGGQLPQGRGGLAQYPVHAGRPIGVGGDLGDDEHLVGHAWSVGLRAHWCDGACAVIQ